MQNVDFKLRKDSGLIQGLIEILFGIIYNI